MTGLRRPGPDLLGRFLFSGWETHEKAVRGSRAARAAPCAGGRRRVRVELPRARRADEPPRPRVARGARGRAGELPRHRPAGVARPRAPGRGRRADARDRGPRAALVRRRVGRPCSASARPRSPPVEPPLVSPRSEGPPKPSPSHDLRSGSDGPLELLESDIARVEARIAELERHARGRLDEHGPRSRRAPGPHATSSRDSSSGGGPLRRGAHTVT